MAIPGILRNRWVGLGFAAMLAASAAALGSAAGAAPAEGTILQAGGVTAVDGSYVVVLKDSVSVSAIDTEAAKLASKHGGAVGHTYRHALRGFEIAVSEAAARQIAALPQVKYVQQNHHVSPSPARRPRCRRGAWTGSTSGPCR